MIVFSHREPIRDGYMVAEDWPTQESAVQAAKLAVQILKPGSGYAGSREPDAVADFIIPLLGLDRDRPYGMSLREELDDEA